MAFNNLINLDLLDRFLDKVKDLIPKVATDTPLQSDMLGSLGTSTKYAREDHVHPAGVAPLASRTYEDIIATENSDRYSGFFYAKVRGTTYDTLWRVTFRVKATVPSNINYETDTTFTITGRQNTYSAWYCNNSIFSTSYRPIYYNSAFFVSGTGYTNNCGNWIGFNLHYSTNPTTTSLKRKVVVELIEYEGCSVELVDTLYTPDTIPERAAHTNWYTNTNTSYSNFSVASQGLVQSGDSNTTSISNLHIASANYIADSVVNRYQMLFQKDEDTLTPLTNTNNTVATTKTMLTDVEFDPFGLILYYATTTIVQASSRITGSSTFYEHGSVDLRYTFNCGTDQLDIYKPFYLVVTPTSNGKCKIASTTPWAQSLPSANDGNWYILLGRTYTAYNITLLPHHPVYYHDGVSVKELLPQTSIVTKEVNGLVPKLPNESTTTKFLRQDGSWSEPSVTTVNGHTVNSNVPANAVFTDTTYESKAAASGGTAVSLVTTGEKYTWNNKGTYNKPSGGIPDSDIASAATWNAKGNGTITGITMNGVSKGTSGVVDLGTVITAHQDISGKADKSATVSNVAYDSTNKKLTKTINGTTSDVVTAATLKTAMALNNVENKSSATIRGELTKANVTTALGYTPPTTNTTYESKVAASGGTDVSLVTTGEKYTWNSKQAALVSGTNIKTINGSSLLGSGNLAVSGLPAVTSSDNDKVLKVVSGAWAAAENGGGTMTISISGFPPNTTTNKTFSEAYAAYQNGSMLFANWNGNFYRLSGVSSTSLSFTNVSVTNDVGVGSSTLTYSSSGAISLSSAGVVKSTPLIIPLLCDDSSDYMDPPSGTLSIEYGNDISDITYESTKREVILVNGYDSYDPYGNYSSDKYRIVSTVFTPGASGDPDTLTIIFRCLGSRNGTSIIKTIVLSGEVYSGVIAVSYSEEPAGSGSMPVNAAVIHVNAPLGSAITFFKDSTVMEAVTAAQTHPNADGKTEDYYYSVPASDFGSWTVVASKSGENDATQSFSILVAKQYDAFLSYLAPYDFQAVEWLQTSTNAYFDTGIIPTTTNYTTKVSLQVAVTNGGNIFNVEGGYGMSKVDNYEQLRYNYASGQTTLNVPGIATVGTDFDIIYNNDSGVVMINGVEVSAHPNIKALDNRQYSILVSAARYGASVTYYGIWRYKRFTVLERDTKNVLIDMHPCYRKMDNMPGFWDSVSNTFMTQLGTGTITVGPDV